MEWRGRARPRPSGGGKSLFSLLLKGEFEDDRYTIIIEKGDGNYSAYCPDLPGVAAAGETEEETVELMKEAIEFHLEGLKEENLPIPSRRSQPEA